MENEIEIWKDVPNYEGLYQVSSFGNVKSMNYNHTGKEQILKAVKRSKYQCVLLYRQGKRIIISVHIIVAMAFKGHVPDGTYKIVVDHKDNNRQNNHVDNLKIITQRENASKDRKGGTSEFIGVHWHKKSCKWYSAINFKSRVIHLGSFDLEIDAAKAYQKALGELNAGLDLNDVYPIGRKNASKYYGVCWVKKERKWKATYKRKYIGSFNTELEAHQAVQNYIASLILKV